MFNWFAISVLYQRPRHFSVNICEFLLLFQDKFESSCREKHFIVESDSSEHDMKGDKNNKIWGILSVKVL